jgi:hypothetical protein
MTVVEHITLGAVARRLNVDLWQVRRLYERRILPEPPRVGQFRVVTEADLPTIEAALREAGYLSDGGPSRAS